MGYTKIHPIKTAIGPSIKYICNDRKTDKSSLISSYCCSPETANFDFTSALSRSDSSGKIKAYHLIQSFAPGEVSYEDAHAIGIELADRHLRGKYSYIVATHIDKGHIHNHIIFCATDFVEHKKYNACRKSYYDIRNISDDICRRYHLSVIENGKDEAKSYKEWVEHNNHSSWKDEIRKDIDNAIEKAASYDDFISIIKSLGYELSGEEQNDSHRKYIAFKKKEMSRYVRGKSNSLGKNYTREAIANRIAYREQERYNPLEETQDPFATDSVDLLTENQVKVITADKLLTDIEKPIDTSDDKFKKKPWLRKWADRENFKLAVRTFAEGGVKGNEKKIADKRKEAESLKLAIAEKERKIKNIGTVIKYASQYNAYRKYELRYEKSKNKERYLWEHESELLYYEGAKSALMKAGINPESIDLEKLKSEYNALTSNIDSANKSYKALLKECETIERQSQNFRDNIDRSSDSNKKNRDEAR